MEFKLRPWNMDDLDSLVENANDYDIAKNLTDVFPHPYTEEDGKKFIAYATSEDVIRIFAIEVDGKAVGAIGLHPQQDIMKKNIELGYWLGKKYWGKGIISKAVKQMVDYAFESFDITRVYARPFGTNVASQKILEKNGFKLEANIEKSIYKNGEFFDELVYGFRVRDREY